MDFDSVLNIASQNQGLSSVPRRYSLKTGPPKKDDRIKGVNSRAVQAFLKKQAMEQKKKEQQHKKEKEDLLAKRVELKSDRKARAMASRTKDNFKGYNGIPIIDQPKKRQSKDSESEEHQLSNTCDEYENDEDNYDYEGTDSESDDQSRPANPPPMPRTEFVNKFATKPKKTHAKSAPPGMNFADLLKLAQKKQFEPVELKVVKKTEERLRTAEEIRELEMERRVKSQDKGKDIRSDKSSGQKDIRSQTSSSSQRSLEREYQQAKRPRVSEDKYQSSKSSQKPKHQASIDRTSDKVHEDRNSLVAFNGTGAINSVKQAPQRPSQSQRSTPSSDLNPKRGSSSLPQVKSGYLGSSSVAGPGAGRPSQVPQKYVGHVRSNSGQTQKSANQGNSSMSNALSRPGSGAAPRPGSSAPPRPGSGAPPRPGSGAPPRPGSGAPPRPGSGAPPRPGSGAPPRPGSSAPPRPGSNAPPRPGTIVRPPSSLQSRTESNAPPRHGSVRPTSSEPSNQSRHGGSMHGQQIAGVARPSNGPRRMGSVSGAPMNGMGSGPGRPPCTVVSETISTKDFASRPGMVQRPQAQQGSKTVIGPSGHRILVRPGVSQGHALPPITSSYKRQYEDEEEYDSEMDDFIDDEGEEQDEISKHIREIFGYDRSKYKDESDYALKFMESSWKDQQKEEARSLRLGIKEDEEDMRMEEEEMKRKLATKTKRKKV